MTADFVLCSAVSAAPAASPATAPLRVLVVDDHPRIRERMEDLKMGEGPYFTFFRPYHLTSL